MKRVNILLLLLALFLQSGGLLLVFHTMKHTAKREMKDLIAAKNVKLETLTISLAEFNRCRIDAREIRLKGKMYDIISSSLSSDSLLELIVVHDTKEEKMIRHIDNLAKESTSKGHQAQNLLTRLMFIPFENKGFQLHAFQSETGVIFYSSNIEKPVGAHVYPPAQPPESL